MGKKVKKCPKQCQRHSFQLKPVHYSAVFSRELSASYCPHSVRTASITPMFNNDNRPFTISFALPADCKKLTMNEEDMRKESQRCRLANENEKSQMFIPKPREKNSYCNVCSSDYDDYLQHIEGYTHTSNIQKNKFNTYIEELVADMGKGDREEDLQNKFQHCSETAMPYFIQESTYFEEKSPLECHPDINACQYQRINNIFLGAKNFHFLKDQKDQVESMDPEQDEASLFHVHTQAKYGGMGSPAKPVISLIINGGINHRFNF